MKIGLEVHVQLPTKSKMFCPCPTTDAPAPNTHVCPTCLGMPGSRPVLNRQVLVYGIMLAKMLNCTIADTTWFSRKTYFYPDMSKSVQITQYDHPIGIKGVYYLNGRKPIRITRIHLEEDPGKTKRTADMSSLVDYNRSGIPLAEIVTEPDLATPAEAREFLTQLVTDIKHTIDLPESGERSIRCDCNISVGKERCEVKNVTGLKNAERALTYEMVRQVKVLKAGGKIDRETRAFDETRGVTYSVRKKEMESDYGYIDEPDLGIFHVGKFAENIKIKESPLNMTLRLAKQYSIDEAKAKQLVATSTDLAALFEELAQATDIPTALTWSTSTVTANWKAFAARQIPTAGIIDAVKKLHAGKITDTECTLELKSYMTGQSAAATQAASADLDTLIGKYLDEHPEILADCKKNVRAANRVIGYIMTQTGGSYSSAEVVASVNGAIRKRL
ncbi:MAG: Asp-tRNA(Asn)/Glu-tRNA(Gln) amidotransferase subunit GatB [Candidatus Methanomethylophilus sp.]|nr:Asp-tRNA(Asn)/Glu-tRNA(Gln) amidotransferase subunit GatB [Methanomethylophilus sp.]MDD4668394.1 Asp-tRNA(Asn)/Glu-tRNA(Gln) amidotransferase subunit GatB [Methanomethylophilus sp.]